MNLVGNAVKFTSRGAVTVSASVESSEHSTASSCSSPSPTPGSASLRGPGADLAPFTQVDASSTRQYGGAGLGLSVSQRLVDLMGGRLWVESEPGKGSVFHFTAGMGLQEEPEPGVRDRLGPDGPTPCPTCRS